ncbi:hypothetical protein J5226_22215 [Lysobacter sp. K5869]|uniref:hypothetical protein n=1 Tax=Lysobacter sp. K5869 TaxID=2820808 RepID=UPI001C060269|nr:hypothetical protein [Lysobacter sp. K5869]QWP76272.1 hypothetical protein J5226_22215 [Lysobacter sp. K5869]
MPSSPDETRVQTLPDPHDDDDDRWELEDGSGLALGEIRTRPLNARDREALVSARSGASGIIGFLGAIALIVAIVFGLVGMYRLDVRVVAAIVVSVVGVLAAVALMMSRQDARLRRDLDAGIQLIVSGRIGDMDSEEGDGPGFVRVLSDETPPRELRFFVEKRLYLRLKPKDSVRIAYVPLSNTLLRLRTDSFSYSLRRKSD